MSSSLDGNTAETRIESNGTPAESREVHGLLVSYKDDEIDQCVHSALQGKKRVHYKCMDVFSNFAAFGTSVGAIYLFRLTTITHASCKLALVIPCDQGSIEVIKFLPGSLQSNDLLVAIGTSRGSLVIFQLACLDESSVRCNELYRAEEFTKSMHESGVRIKLIEYDLELLDGYATGHANPNCAFSKLYICDQKDRIFVLESSSIYPAFRLLYSHKPSHVLSVDESTVHQICVHRSQLLMSTDEKTSVFREHTNELITIGKRQRKTKGFFGACFFGANYKPARLLSSSLASRSRANIVSSQQTIYSSASSLAELENLLIFVARPKFSLWQVNNQRQVMFTHIFDSLIRATPASAAVGLCNSPIEGLHEDDCDAIEEAFLGQQLSSDQSNSSSEPKSDHFGKLIPIFSTTLGNLLLSHSKHELFIIDPIRARLIAWYQHVEPITQVCCNENEIFILSEPNKRQFRVDRLVLLAPTQFVLELHRVNRFLSLMVFVQTFCHQMRQLMALPLLGPNTITTEGGLLRNILWNTWRELNHASSISIALNGESHQLPKFDLNRFSVFKRLVEEILDESRQLKQSIENLADSRLMFAVSNENIERLCSEPYASMVSLDISIANLHTDHVVHFSQEALERHKSIAKLSQSIINLSKLRRASTQASLVMNETLANSTSDMHGQRPEIDFNDKRVIVEQLQPKQRATNSDKVDTKNVFTVIKEIQASQESVGERKQASEPLSERQEVSLELAQVARLKDELGGQQQAAKQVEFVDDTRCPHCRWPRARAHLRPMHHSQQIQHNWIQQNLLPNFEENVDKIEERAFRHGLWHLILKCYAFRNQLDDYITCCIMLDDVRLLNIERFLFALTDCNEDDLIERVFEQLKLKLDSASAEEDESESSEARIDKVGRSLCFKCKGEVAVSSEGSELSDDGASENNSQPSERPDLEDDISFNLVNFFKRFMLGRKNSDIKLAVARLLQHPDLLNSSKISANFYLQAIANQCAIVRRTRLKVR